MGRQIAVGWVKFRFVEAGGGDAALQIVGDQQGRRPIDVLQSADMAANPVRQALGPGGFAVGVVGGAQYGDKDGRLPNLAGHRIDNGHRWASIVDEQLLAWGVRLAHAERESTDPPPIVGAEAAVAIAGWVLRFVFLPEQVERDAFAPQFPMHRRPIGFRTALARWCRWRIKLRLQAHLTHSGRQRIAETALLRPAENFTDRRR